MSRWITGCYWSAWSFAVNCLHIFAYRMSLWEVTSMQQGERCRRQMWMQRCMYSSKPTATWLDRLALQSVECCRLLLLPLTWVSFSAAGLTSTLPVSLCTLHFFAHIRLTGISCENGDLSWLLGYLVPVMYYIISVKKVMCSSVLISLIVSWMYTKTTGLTVTEWVERWNISHGINR